MVKTTEFNVQTQMNYVVGNMSGFTAAYTGMDNLSALISSLMTSYTTLAGTGRAAYASIGAAIAAVGLKSAEAFGEFQRGMNIVKAIGNNTNAQMQILAQTANQFSSQFRMDISDINDGLTTLGRAGLTDVNNQIQVLQNGLQVAKLEGMNLAATLEDIVTTTSLLGGDVTRNDFGAQSSKVSNLLVATSLSGPLDVGDVIETLKFAGGSAAAAGANLNNEEGLKDLLGTIGAFSQKGVIGSIAGTALRAFITKPASQDKTVKDALAELGLDAYSLWEKDEKNGWQMRPIAEQIGLITDAMDKQHMTNLDRIEVWGDIVGNKMGQQMLKLDENKIKDVTKDIEHQRNLEDIYQGTLTNFASQMERLNQVFQSIYRNLGSGFATNLTSIVEGAANILEFINGIGNGVLFKIIATIIGPLGLAGLSKGLRDFGQILGALKDNIKKSASEDVWSQDLWSTQRGVIEKRMNKGETIIAQDEWSSFLKKDEKSSSYHRETEEEYKARMDKREQDYQERQNKRDEEAQKRQAKKDEAYREQQAERNRLYKEQLTRLTQMSVGARFVQVEGSSIVLDSTKLNIDFGESVAPMSNAVAEEIRRRENVSQDLPQQKTVEKLSGASVNDLKAGANYLVPQKGKMSTSFSQVDKYAILLNEEGDNSVLNDEAYNHLRGIEKEYRAGVGVMMEAQRKGALFDFTNEDLNTLHAAQEVGDVTGRTFMTKDAKEALIGMFKTSGVTNISGVRIETIFNEQLKSMVDNFTERGIYDDIFEIDEAGNIGVQKGQESLLAEKMSERVMSTIDHMYHNRIDLKSIYKDDFFDSAYFDEKNKTNPYKDFNKFLEERFKENSNIDKGKIKDWQKMGYRIELLDFLNLGGVDMQGFNTYEAGLKANKNIPNQAVDAIIHNKLFSKLGFISQDTTLATDVLTLMKDGMDGTSGVVADAIRAEVEDAKNAISSFDPYAEITSKWVNPIDIGVHQVVTQGLKRSSPGEAAQGFIDEKNDIKNALDETARVIERGLQLTQRAALRFGSNAVIFDDIDSAIMPLEKMIENPSERKDRANRLGKSEADYIRSKNGIYRTRLKQIAEFSDLVFDQAYGLAYATSPGEQKGLSILIDKLTSNANMKNQFKTSKFKDLIEQWEEENLITTDEKGALKNISNRALKQLFNPKTGFGLLTALEDHMYQDLHVRRFQTDEEIDSVYKSRLGLGNKPDPRLYLNEFAVLDTETNTTSDRAEKQMIQYAILDAEKIGLDGVVPDDAIQSAIINSKNKIQEHAESISGISNELKKKEGEEEVFFYDKLTRDLLKIINDGKAIVAHNTPFDKSVILSNIARFAAAGHYDLNDYQISDEFGNISYGNIYDAITALDKATWYDTLEEIKPYEHAKDVYGNDIFVDRETGERSTKNVPVAEVLTGKEYDRSLTHRADFDVLATYDTTKAIGASNEGELLYNTVYARFSEEYTRFMKNYKPLKKRFFKSLGQFDTIQEFSIAEKLFSQLYAEEGLDKLDLFSNIKEDRDKLQEAKRRFIQRYNKAMVEYDEAIISSRITAGIKLLERVLDPESALVDTTPDLRSSPPISKTPGSGTHHTPGDAAVTENKTAVTEEEIMKFIPKHYVPYEFKANYISEKKEAKQLIEFFNSDLYKEVTGGTALTLEAFEKISHEALSNESLLTSAEFQSIAHLIDSVVYGAIHIPKEEFDRTHILGNLENNQFGYIDKIPEEMLENPSQRAIMEAIRRAGLSNIMIGNQSVASLLNQGMFGKISQSDLLSLLSSGKIITDNKDSLGYRTHKGEEFHPTRTYEELNQEEKNFVDFFEERLTRMFNYESLGLKLSELPESLPGEGRVNDAVIYAMDNALATILQNLRMEFGSYDSLGPVSRKRLKKRIRDESIGLLSDEYFEDNSPKTQEGVDNASPELKYIPKKGNFNDIVMTLMQRPLKDLVQMLDNPEDIIGYIEPQISNGKYNEGKISLKGADALASMISEKLTIYETIFNDKFEDGIFYYSSKIGGQEIGNGSFKTFEDIPMIKNLMQMYQDLTGDPYTLLYGTKSRKTADAEMKEKFTRIQNGENALKALKKMEKEGTIDYPHNAELVQKLKDEVALGQQTQEALSKKKLKDSFSPDVTRAPGYKDFSAVRKAEQFLLDKEERVRQLDSYFYKQLGIDGFKLSLGEQSTKINKTVKGMGKNALDSLLSQNIPEGKEFSYDDFEAIEQEFRKQLAELPQFVQTMIEEIINKAPSFYEAMRILSSEGIKGFKIGAEINSPPAVIRELIYYIRTLPQEVIASAPAFKNAMYLYGQGVLGLDPAVIDNFDKIIGSDFLFKADALKLSAQYNRNNITQDQYFNDLYKLMGIDSPKALMSHKDFGSAMNEVFLGFLRNEIDQNQAKSKVQQIVAQYENDNRIRGIRSRAAPEEIFRKAIPELNAQYKENIITMEEYIKKTMQLMGVEERRLMTEEDLTNKLLDLSRKLSEGTITEPEAEQESAVLHNQYIEDQRKRAERERKAEREANIAQGGAKGFAYNAYYKLQNAPSKIASFLGKAGNALMGLTMNPIIMLGEMVWGFIQQGIEFWRQQEQEKIAKLSEIASDADSAFEDQQSKWEEAQAKDNEDFNDLSDNEKQDAMLDAIAQGREDFNSASAETKALIGKQNELISANNNLISEKMDDTLTGYNGLQANYTELMEGSGMYGTKDEYGIMDFLESIVNPDKLVDNSNTRRLDALSESSIQIDTRVKNMEEFTEDYQQVMASMGIAHRSILDIYNVRGIMKESELKDTFFNQSPSNAMRIGAPNLMSPEKLAGIMKQQEKVLQRFENRYLRFIKAGTGKDRHIEVTLGDGSIHKLAQQLGLKDIEAAQVLAVHQLQRIQDVMINQVEPQLAQQTLGIYNNTYQLGEANNKSDVQTMFQNTMSQGILAIQMQVAQLVYKAAMEQALQDYQAETGDTKTNTVGLLLNKARDTTAENHEIAKKFSARGWGSYLQSRDVNALVNQGYTEEQAIQKLAQQKGVSADQLTNAYAQSSYNELGKYGYNGQERWLKNNLTWLIPAALGVTGAAVGSLAGPIGTIGGAELGGGLGSAALAMLGLSEGVTIGTAGTAALSGLAGAGIGAGLTGIGGAVYQGVTDGLTDFSDPFSEHTNEMMRSYANSIPLDSTIEALNDSQVAADEEGNNGSDTDDSDANKQRYVQLAICNKKAIPKLNVNLFKKAPTFTVLNKNFKLRDIKINTADKAKNIENSLKNAIIDVQERSDPKIIQDSEAEYDPVGATDDATNLPTGASLTK